MKKILLMVAVISTNLIIGQKLQGKGENLSVESSFSLKSISDRTIEKIEADKEGNFSLEKLNLSEGYYMLRKDNETAYIYLTKHDDLNINFEASDFVNTLKFSGKGAEKNNYLLDKNRYNREARKDSDTFYGGTESDYLKNIKDLNKSIKEMFDKVSADSKFIENEKVDLEFDYLLDIYNYENLQKFYFGKEVVALKEFLKPLNGVNYDLNELYSKYPSYKNLASLKWKKDIEKADGFEQMNAVFSKIKTVPLKIDVLISFYYSISSKPKKADDYYKLVKAYVRDEKFLGEAKKQWESVNSTAKGKKSPGFSFSDINGNTVSLQSFKGKFVFIDVWATWCQPCMQQIPFIKKLEEKFQGKNIVFVGLSVDDKNKYDLWKETVELKHMKGIQLFTDKSFDSDFIRAYGIASIPRFILIDPEGNIVNSHMSKPSDTETEKVLSELLN